MVRITLSSILILAVDPEPGLSDFPRCSAGILRGCVGMFDRAEAEMSGFYYR